MNCVKVVAMSHHIHALSFSLKSSGNRSQYWQMQHRHRASQSRQTARQWLHCCQRDLSKPHGTEEDATASLVLRCHSKQVAAFMPSDKTITRALHDCQHCFTRMLFPDPLSLGTTSSRTSPGHGITHPGLRFRALGIGSKRDSSCLGLMPDALPVWSCCCGCLRLTGGSCSLSSPLS